MSASGAIKRLMPLMDRVLVEKLSPAQKTTGGVLLPEQASSKTVEGNVLAVGPGKLSSDGTRLPMSVQEGDRVLLPEFGGQKVSMQDKGDTYLFRDDELLGIVH